MWDKKKDWMEWLHEERGKMEAERKQSGISWSAQMQKEAESLQKQGFKIVEVQRK